MPRTSEDVDRGFAACSCSNALKISTDFSRHSTSGNHLSLVSNLRWDFRICGVCLLMLGGFSGNRYFCRDGRFLRFVRQRLAAVVSTGTMSDVRDCVGPWIRCCATVRSSSSHPAEIFSVGTQYRTGKRDVHLTDDLWPRFSNRISKRPLRAADPLPNAMRSSIK